MIISFSNMLLLWCLQDQGAVGVVHDIGNRKVRSCRV